MEPMYIRVVGEVAPLAQRGKIFIAVVARIVIKVGDGENDFYNVKRAFGGKDIKRRPTSILNINDTERMHFMEYTLFITEPPCPIKDPAPFAPISGTL